MEQAEPYFKTVEALLKGEPCPMDRMAMSIGIEPFASGGKLWSDCIDRTGMGIHGPMFDPASGASKGTHKTKDGVKLARLHQRKSYGLAAASDVARIVRLYGAMITDVSGVYWCCKNNGQRERLIADDEAERWIGRRLSGNQNPTIDEVEGWVREAVKIQGITRQGFERVLNRQGLFFEWVGDMARGEYRLQQFAPELTPMKRRTLYSDIEWFMNQPEYLSDEAWDLFVRASEGWDIEAKKLWMDWGLNYAYNLTQFIRGCAVMREKLISDG